MDFLRKSLFSFEKIWICWIYDVDIRNESCFEKVCFYEFIVFYDSICSYEFMFLGNRDLFSYDLFSPLQNHSFTSTYDYYCTFLQELSAGAGAHRAREARSGGGVTPAGAADLNAYAVAPSPAPGGGGESTYAL